jgi:hypothetical protein
MKKLSSRDLWSLSVRFLHSSKDSHSNRGATGAVSDAVRWHSVGSPSIVAVAVTLPPDILRSVATVIAGVPCPSLIVPALTDHRYPSLGPATDTFTLNVMLSPGFVTPAGPTTLIDGH